jgi:uncharacterized membrane protein
METIEKSIEVNAPVRTVYNQWTQFEDFPQFMEGIQEVRQIDDRHLHWKAEIGGRTKEWDAEIFEQVPDEKISWRSTTGAQNSGLVRFDKASDSKTKITLAISYEPEGAMEKMGDAMGLMSSRISGDLKRFQEFIEERGRATGGWRGEIHGREVQEDSGEPRSKRLHGSSTNR